MVEKNKTQRNQQIFKLSQWLARFNWVDHVYNDEEKFFKKIYYIREISQMVLLYLWRFNKERLSLKKVPIIFKFYILDFQ